MEDFSGLALPPLFGGHILEAELEPGGVELSPGEVELDSGGNEPLESRTQEDEEKRALDKRKYLALSKRCKEIEQVNQKIVSRLQQVQRITRRIKKERRFLMKTLDGHGDDYRNAQLTILLEEESGALLDPVGGIEDEKPTELTSSFVSAQQANVPKKKRHRIPRHEKDKDQQIEADMAVLSETQFGDIPSPTSLSH